MCLGLRYRDSMHLFVNWLRQHTDYHTEQRKYAGGFRL